MRDMFLCFIQNCLCDDRDMCVKYNFDCKKCGKSDKIADLLIENKWVILEEKGGDT